MILDTSAIVAIVLDEPERPSFIASINAAARVAVGAPTLVEAGIVLSARTGEDMTGVLQALTGAMDVTIIEFDALHWQTALDAWQRFGKSRHDARLNFGDCLTYAVARVAGEPLLAKGDDFPRTDLELA